jgi:hypothetical protein
MRLPRIRMWFLMAIVAMVAIVLAARIMSKRSRFFRSQAVFFAAQEALCNKYIELDAGMNEMWLGRRHRALELVASSDGRPLDRSTPPEVVREHYRLRKNREWSDALTRQRDYYAQMKQKYEWAASHPWESVPPDPPEPRLPPVEVDPEIFFESPWKSWRSSPP